MNPLAKWADNRRRKELRKFDQEHRWDALGRYNAERHRGIVHRPDWEARMRAEQMAFDVEHGMTDSPFPITLEGNR